MSSEVGVNSNVARALAAGVSDIERRLAEVENLLAREDVHDVSEAERRLLVGHFVLIRQRLDEGLRAFGFRRPRRRTQARAHTSTALTFVGIALDDLSSKRLRGYGSLSETSAAALDVVLADVTHTVRMAQAVLTRPSDDLDARLARLKGSILDIREVAAVSGVVVRRGLVELRGALAALTELLETETLEVAVFGRVSSGKSSLLNAVLEMSLLPVGALPVTALPTRTTWGETARCQVQIQGAEQPEDVDIGRLSDFVTEERNPRNCRHVERVTVFVPSTRLRAGVALVDTPGVGSLALSGARETYAYLPRCDRAILTVAAAGVLEHDDLTLLARLHDSAIPISVVVTKSDLLPENERERFVAYVRDSVRQALGIEVPVSLVSVLPASAGTAEAWFLREIEPLVLHVREAREASARRKLHAIRRAATEALRASHEGDSTSSTDAHTRAALDVVAGELEVGLEKFRARCHDVCGDSTALAATTIRLAAGRLDESGRMLPSDAIGAALLDTADELIRRVRDELLSARDRARDLLRRAAIHGAEVTPEEIAVDFVPMPAVGTPAFVELQLGRFARVPPGRRHRLERTLTDSFSEPLVGALSSYTTALRAWARAEVERLGEQAAAQLELARAPTRVHSPISGASDPDLAADLRILEGAS